MRPENFQDWHALVLLCARTPKSKEKLPATVRLLSDLLTLPPALNFPSSWVSLPQPAWSTKSSQSCGLWPPHNAYLPVPGSPQQQWDHTRPQPATHGPVLKSEPSCPRLIISLCVSPHPEHGQTDCSASTGNGSWGCLHPRAFTEFSVDKSQKSGETSF